jgi:hypothetical protein
VSADEFVRYRITTTTIDGPPFDERTEVGLKVLGVVGGLRDVEHAGRGAAGVEVYGLRIVDWGGPWQEKHNDPDPPAVPDHVLRAATLAVRRELDSYTTHLPEPMPEALARAALEAAAHLRETPREGFLIDPDGPSSIPPGTL